MDFRKKLLILTVSGMTFAGLAYGDACAAAATQPNLTPNLLRIEGTAELLADDIVSCTGDTLSATTGQVIANLGLPVTSKQTASSPVASEATLVITVGGTFNPLNGLIVGGTPFAYPGTVSGSSVTFGTTAAPVVFPTTAYFIRVANIRVNASGGALATYVTESLLATNQGVVIYATTPVNVGYIQQGFLPPSVSGVNNYVICTGNPAKAPISNSFAVKISENFGGAFKNQTNAGTCGTAACSVTNGEQGSYVPGGGSAVGTANSGTLFLFSFANIQTALGEVVYLPLTATNGTLTFTLITSLSNTTPVTATAGTGLPAGYAAITSANNTATAVYDVTATDNTILGENATIVGYITANAGFSPGAVTGVTVTVTPAGTGSVNPTLVIPNFTVSSNSALLLSAFGVCQTSLLFPFVSTQQGYETGIVLANTSTDPFGTPTTPGTCALNLYGAGAPTPNTGIVSGPLAASIASGSTLAFQLSGSGIAAGFQGYAIAVCNFQYAHGYAFIQNGSGTSAYAQGYLALVFNSTGVVRGPATPEGLQN